MTKPRKAQAVKAVGSKTQWGRVAAVGIIGGERYYWMVDRYGCVAMLPADVVEPVRKGR